MRNKLLLIIAIFFLITLPASAQLTTKLTAVQPHFLTAFETATVFRNPADLTYFNYVFGGALTYGPYDERFSGSIVAKVPDWGIGDFGFGVEYFGTNFAENLIWIDDSDGGHFSLTKGGYKQSFTWAKSTRFFRIGLNLKHYYYRELDTNTNERGIGVDAGIYLTPFKDMLLGIYSTDIGGTRITDADNPNILKKTVSNRTWVSATILSGGDTYITAGIPTDILKNYENTKGLWRKSSFSIRKIFSQTIITEIGYNSKDVYAGIGYNFNDFISLEYLVSNDVYTPDGVYRHLLVLSYGIPIESGYLIGAAFKTAPSVVTAPFNPKNVGRPYNPWMDSPFWWMGVRQPIISRTILLKNREASGLVSIAEDMLSPEGTIQIDDATNSLIVSDYEENVKRIKSTINKLDWATGSDN